MNTPDIVIAALREVFEGAPPFGPTFLSDHTSASGLLGTIAMCDVHLATTPARSSGPTIAAHVHHVAFSLTVARARMAGATAPTDWEGSWRVGPLDAAAWDALRDRLADEHRRTVALLVALSSDPGRANPRADTPGRDSPDGLEPHHNATWALAHAAYHLGAVRAAWRSLVEDARPHVGLPRSS